MPRWKGVLRLLGELASGERIVVAATHDTQIMPFADRAVRLPDFSAIDSEPETVGVASVSGLFEQGSMGDLIYVVVDGELEVVRESADGAEQLLKIATPGEYVGEIGPLFCVPPRRRCAHAPTRSLLATPWRHSTDYSKLTPSVA